MGSMDFHHFLEWFNVTFRAKSPFSDIGQPSLDSLGFDEDILLDFFVTVFFETFLFILTVS